MNSTQIGNISEGMVTAALLRVGHSVLLPVGSQRDYDLVFDDGKRLARVQCKTGRIRGGAVQFKTCTVVKVWGTGKVTSRSHTEVDFFGIYCPQNGKVYLVPREDVDSTQGTLRLVRPRNGQKLAIRWASTYEIAAMA